MLNRFRETAHQVISVGDLRSGRGALVPSFGIKAASVPSNDLDSTMLLKPVGKARGGSNRDQIDDASLLQIHQNGSVLLMLAPCPVIHLQDAYLRLSFERCLLFHPAQDCVSTCFHSQ